MWLSCIFPKIASIRKKKSIKAEIFSIRTSHDYDGGDDDDDDGGSDDDDGDDDDDDDGSDGSLDYALMQAGPSPLPGPSNQA